MNNEWDFGFTATTVEELDFIQQEKVEHKETTDQLAKKIERLTASDSVNEHKLQELYNAIMPLLTNLEKDADTRDYIYWPNRAEKIEEFRKHLTAIYKSSGEKNR